MGCSTSKQIPQHLSISGVRGTDKLNSEDFHIEDLQAVTDGSTSTVDPFGHFTSGGILETGGRRMFTNMTVPVELRNKSIIKLEEIASNRNMGTLDMGVPPDEQRKQLVSLNRKKIKRSSSYKVQSNESTFEEVSSWIDDLFIVCDTQHAGMITTEKLVEHINSKNIETENNRILKSVKSLMHLDELRFGLNKEQFSIKMKGLFHDDEINNWADFTECELINSTQRCSIRSIHQRTAPRNITHDYHVGHSDRIKNVAISLNELFYVTTNHLTVVLWDTRLGVKRQQFVGHTEPVMHVEISPNTSYVATSSRDYTLGIWDSLCGLLLQSIEHPGIVTCSLFSEDGQSIISGCQDNLIRRHIIKTGRLQWASPQKSDFRLGVILTLCHACEYKYVCSVSSDMTTRVRDSDTLNTLFQLEGHNELCWGILSKNELILTYSDSRILLHTAPGSPERVVSGGLTLDNWSIEDILEDMSTISTDDDPVVISCVAFTPGPWEHIAIVCVFFSIAKKNLKFSIKQPDHRQQHVSQFRFDAYHHLHLSTHLIRLTLFIQWLVVFRYVFFK